VSGSRASLAPNGPAVQSAKPERQRAIREIVRSEAIASQQDLADRLAERGFAVTQATVSRDIAELGLAKAWRRDHHVYILEDVPGGSAGGSDERLRRILTDIPVTIARSGLILVLTGGPGTASVIAQAIDESTLREQVGTVAGDNTLIVLFADEPALARWLERFTTLQSSVALGAGSEVSS
jgi:transcriptional regulator of arginine metabolism